MHRLVSVDGNKVNQIILESGLEIQEIEKRSDLAPNTLIKLRNGYAVRPKTVLKFCRSLNIKPKEIIKNE